MFDAFFFVAVVSSVLFGMFLIQKPLAAFEFQRRFYRLINWDIKPISVEKEIRNTKGMGVFLLLASVAAVGWRIFHA
jgi:hypothetical protein